MRIKIVKQRVAMHRHDTTNDDNDNNKHDDKIDSI